MVGMGFTPWKRSLYLSSGELGRLMFGVMARAGEVSVGVPPPAGEALNVLDAMLGVTG